MSEGYFLKVENTNVFIYESSGQVLDISSFYSKDPSKTQEKLEKTLHRHNITDPIVIQKLYTELATNFNETPKPDDQAPKEKPIDPSIMAEAEAALNSGDPMENIAGYLDKIITGETQNKRLIFALLLSGKYPNKKMKQIVVLTEQPGAGKTTLANSITNLFRTHKVGRLTAHALDYSELANYEILYIQELGYLDAEDQGVSTLKFFSSEDQGYTIDFVIKDEHGRLKTEEKKLDPITIVTSKAKIELDDQLKRRAWVLSPDTSEEQTAMVLNFKKKSNNQEDEKALSILEETEKEHANKVLKAVVSLINPYEVIIPYRNSLYSLLNKRILRSRGDADKLEALVKLLSLIYQRKLPKLKKGEKEVIVATPFILDKALEIGYDALITMTTNVEPPVRKLFEAIRSVLSNGPELRFGHEGEVYDRGDRERLARYLNVTEKTVRNYFKALVREGIASDEHESKKAEIKFKLIRDFEDILATDSSIGKFVGKSVGNRVFPTKFARNCILETIGVLIKLVGKTNPGGITIFNGELLNFNDGVVSITYNPGGSPLFILKKLAYPPQVDFPTKFDNMKQNQNPLEILGFQPNFQPTELGIYGQDINALLASSKLLTKYKSEAGETDREKQLKDFLIETYERAGSTFKIYSCQRCNFRVLDIVQALAHLEVHKQ